MVYLLWGEYAQKKGRLVDESRHRVLRGPHPSPLVRYVPPSTTLARRHTSTHPVGGSSAGARVRGLQPLRAVQ